MRSVTFIPYNRIFVFLFTVKYNHAIAFRMLKPEIYAEC